MKNFVVGQTIMNPLCEGADSLYPSAIVEGVGRDWLVVRLESGAPLFVTGFDLEYLSKEGIIKPEEKEEGAPRKAAPFNPDTNHKDWSRFISKYAAAEE